MTGDKAVVGWWAVGEPGKGAVLLLHGVRADRTQMLQRALFLRREGYATLLIDLPAHGESDGDQITFGARESAGVSAALAFLRRELPNERIGVIGVSLGAASAVLARLSPPPDAVVLESMYPTIDEAVVGRLNATLGAWGAYLAPPLLWQLPLRAGIEATALRPIDGLSSLGAPVMIASGSDDRYTSWAETVRLFESASEPKELWRVDGAAHVDLHTFSPQAYERNVLRFLATHVRGQQ
jgi:alpha-beta hydrolase superfamily lysophospholipase